MLVIEGWKKKKAPQRDTEWENSPCCCGDLKESFCCCLPELTLGALRGAEDSVRSLCSPLQSVPFYRQFLSCIDVASHYCRVPINPAFIRPRLLIHFFLSLLTSLTQSSHCSLIPIFFPSVPFFSPQREMSSSISVASLWALRRERWTLRGKEGTGFLWPPFLGDLSETFA